jgi:hypothetical protein
MSFDWVGYLAVARELARGTPQTINREARLRSAISRSYYAAFIKARNHLRDQNGLVTPTSANPHQYVINQLLYSRTSVRRRIGWDLLYLRRERNKADYVDSYPDLDTEVTEVLQRSGRVVSRLDRL